MQQKRRITRVRFSYSSGTADPPVTPTPVSPSALSNISTPVTASPQTPTFDSIMIKVFSKSLIISLTKKDLVLKEVRACILIINED